MNFASFKKAARDFCHRYADCIPFILYSESSFTEKKASHPAVAAMQKRCKGLMANAHTTIERVAEKTRTNQSLVPPLRTLAKMRQTPHP